MSDSNESFFGLSEETLRAATDALPSQEELDSLVEAVRRGQERLERSREHAEEYINIGPPWNYDPDNYSPSEEAILTAMKWTYEGREYLEGTGDPDLEIIAGRIEEGSKSFAEESDDSDTEYPYKGLHLLLSSLDGLITWLCENDPDIDPNHCNDGDEPVYLGRQKKSALEKWYDEHAIFGVEDDEGDAFREKWNDFWHHRHRIMHGSPYAYYDENIGVATLFFVGLTAHVVKERYDELN
ncbi:hypothetical protein [Halarchaeum nitratireducens]|nr:hypothetical protein [Halarchaeum nitratireducens]